MLCKILKIRHTFCSTYLLVHFNVQAIGHLIVLKVKRVAVNSQMKCVHFPKPVWGGGWPNGTFMIRLLKKFKSSSKASYGGGGGGGRREGGG